MVQAEMIPVMIWKPMNSEVIIKNIGVMKFDSTVLKGHFEMHF